MTEMTNRLPMMGRDDVLQKLRERLQSTREGSGGKLALMGESGMGKSRVAREIAEEARRAGMLVGVIEYRGSKLRPYEPMADLVREMLGIDPASRRDAQRMPLSQGLDAMGYGKFETAFARLLRIEGSGPAPSAAAMMDASSIRPPSTIDGPIEDFDFDGTVHDMQVKLELGDMLAMMLQGLAQQGNSILLILEDLDEAAEIARTVAMRLMEDIENLPILILATYSPAASRDLHAGFRGSSIPLRPLTKEQATEIGAAAMDITWLTKEMSDAVWDATGGNPLLITLLMQHLAHVERLRIRPGDRLGELVGDDPVPSGNDLIVAYIRTLPPMLLKTLLNAVVLGDGFRVGALGALYESRSEDDLIADLDALIERGFMETSGTGRNAVYRFTHGVVRDTLYETAPPDKRAQMHHRAAEYYSIPMPGRKPRTESVIYHYSRAGEVEQALGVIDRSLHKAQADGSREQVVALHQEALNVMAEVPELADQRNSIAERLGDMHVGAREYQQAALAYQNADLQGADPLLVAKVGLSMLAVDPSQAIVFMQRAAPGIPLEYDFDLRWRLEAGQAWGLALLGRTYDEVRKTRDALGTLSSSAGFGSARTMMRGALGMALYYHGDQAEATPHLESARAGYGARGDEDGMLFINQVLIGMPREEITQLWLNLMLKPLVRSAE